MVRSARSGSADLDVQVRDRDAIDVAREEIDEPPRRAAATSSHAPCSGPFATRRPSSAGSSAPRTDLREGARGHRGASKRTAPNVIEARPDIARVR